MNKKKFQDKTFEEKKAEGLITTEKPNDSEVIVLHKQFDANTGEVTFPKEERYIKSTLQVRKLELEKELEKVTALLKEF